MTESFKIFTDKEERRQFFFAIRELTSRELKRKYARSFLGVIWSVLNPLLLMLVMTMIFSYMFRREIENFPIYYLTGITLWTLFSSATSSAMTALVDNRMMLLKVKLPKQTFVLSRIVTALVNFGYSMIAFALILAVYIIRGKIALNWTVLLLPIDALFIFMFSLGIGYALAIIFVFFADIKYLYSVLLRLWMYLTAIFYPVDRLPDFLQYCFGFNPIYVGVYIARLSIMEGELAPLSWWIRLAAYGIVSLALGYTIFAKFENNVMEHM